MKGDAKIIAILNEVLKAELTAINQYFLHAEMCENWGYERMAKHIRKESIEEMQHAEILMERILYLDGTPNMSDYFKINIGQNLKQQLQNDLRSRIHGRQAPERRNQIQRRGRRQRFARIDGEDSPGRGTPYRLAGGPTLHDQRDDLRELFGAANGRRERKLVAGQIVSVSIRVNRFSKASLRGAREDLVLGEAIWECRVAPSPKVHSMLLESGRRSWRRRDGRVAEGARLESVFRGNSNVGSNPTLSAMFSMG